MSVCWGAAGLPVWSCLVLVEGGDGRLAVLRDKRVLQVGHTPFPLPSLQR